HVRHVGVPGQHVEGGRVLPQQVVADPVVPDQVVGPHPGEHAGELAALEHARPLRAPHRQRRRPLGQEQRRHRLGGRVEDGDEERQRTDPPLAGGGQVAGQGGGGDAAGAGADEVHVGAAGDEGGGGDRLERGGHVGVEVPVATGRRRVAPADDEDVVALVDEELHQAAAGGEVEDVVAADLGGDEHDRHGADGRRRRLVLDELQDLGAEHYRAGRDGDRLAGTERPAVDGLRHRAVVEDVAGQRQAALGQ